MSLLTTIYNTIKPPINSLIRLIDLLVVIITGTLSSMLVLGIAIVQDHKLSTIGGPRLINGSGEDVPTEEELADWNINLEERIPYLSADIVDLGFPAEYLEGRQLEQEIMSVIEAPHPYSLGDHNKDELTHFHEVALTEEVELTEEFWNGEVENK